MATAVDKLPSNPLTDGVGTSSNRDTIACTTGAAHTLGAYVEIDPSLSADADGIAVNMRSLLSANATDSSTLLRIGTGTAGAETTWATISVGYNTYSSGAGAASGDYLVIPGRITSGTRVAVCAQSARATLDVSAIYVFLASDKTTDYGSPVSMGFNTATSRGVDLTAPGSLNTKGAWTELVASTSQAFTTLAVGIQAAAGTGMNKTGVLIDIGVGGAGAETVLIPDIYVEGQTSEKYVTFSPVTYGVDVSSGARISARYARANANNAVDICLVGA